MPMHIMSKTNIEILDDCVNGSVDTLTQLVGDKHEDFRKFCNIYRDLFGEKREVKCNTLNDKVVFSVECSDKDINYDAIEVISQTSIIEVSRTKTTTTVNISVSK